MKNATILPSLLALLILPTGCERIAQPPTRPPEKEAGRPTAPGPRRATPPPARITTTPARLAPFALPSGEGMWPWADLGQLDEAALRKRGLRISLASLWTPGRGGLASAVVGYGNGCTGSFLSAEGLIITNHHCAFRSIQRNSTPERDLLQTGFQAANRQAELNGYGARVYVFRNQTDVTTKIVSALPKGADDHAVIRVIEAREKALVAACEKKPHTRCRISRENDGLRFLLLENTALKDVRLVAAPGPWATSAARSTTSAGRDTPWTSPSCGPTWRPTGRPGRTTRTTSPIGPKRICACSPAASPGETSSWCSVRRGAPTATPPPPTWSGTSAGTTPSGSGCSLTGSPPCGPRPPACPPPSSPPRAG